MIPINTSFLLLPKTYPHTSCTYIPLLSKMLRTALAQSTRNLAARRFASTASTASTTASNAATSAANAIPNVQRAGFRGRRFGAFRGGYVYSIIIIIFFLLLKIFTIFHMLTFFFFFFLLLVTFRFLGFVIGSLVAGSFTSKYLLNEYRASNNVVVGQVVALNESVARLEGHVKYLENQISK